MCEFRPCKTPGLESEELEGLDEVVYVRTEDGSSFSLNLTAAAVLELCDGHRTPEQIASLIADWSGEEPAGIQHDISAILAEFAEYGLITEESQKGVEHRR